MSVLPPSLRGSRAELPRVLTIAGTRRMGMSRAAVDHAIERFGWQRITRGVLLTVPGEPSRVDWANIGLSLAGPGSALSGWDALRICGLGQPTPPTDTVLVVARRGDHRETGAVRIRTTRRPYRATTMSSEHPDLPGAAIVFVARAIADAALDYRSLGPVRALVTTAIQKERCSPADLVAELGSCPRNHSALLRRALADVIDGARSIAEAEAVDFLRRGRVPAFELNVPILDHTGEVIAVADVLWRELRAIAEIDSAEFHYGEAGWKGTGRRHNKLTTAGLALEHFPPSEIRARTLDWARDVAIWLRSRADELGLPYVPGHGPIRPGPDGPAPVWLPPPSR